MSYRVRYTRRAMEQLASIWMNAADRGGVTAASHAIERLLTVDPFGQSESRGPGYRVIIVRPLSAQFTVSETARKVTIVWFHLRVDHPPRP